MSAEVSYLDTLPKRASMDDDESEKRIAELAKVTAVRYGRERSDAAKELGLKVGVLDALVERQRKKDSKTRDDYPFEQIEPWQRPVDGALLLDRIASLVRRYVVLDARGVEAGTVALWTLHSFCHDAFDMSPVLAIESATPRCGKTTLLSIIGQLVHRGITASNISPAAIYRFIESNRPTLLMDEADAWLRNRDGRSNEEARSVLNSGHTRAGAIVIRCEGEELKPKPFSTWCPKVIALIGKLPATLQDRSIVIVLRRKLKKDQVQRFVLNKVSAELAEIRRQCLRWKRDNFAALKVWDDESSMAESMNDRACDNWRPLVAIADLAERSRKHAAVAKAEQWSARARAAAQELSGIEHEEPELLARLLADIDAVLCERQVDRISSQELAAELGRLEDQPWSEWGRQARPISPVQLARLLDPLGIKPRKIRFTAGPANGYELTQFADAFARYPRHRNGTPEQTNIFNGLDANRTGTEAEHVPVRNAGNPLNDKECSGVPFQCGGVGHTAKPADCATCRNFKRISAETGECTEHHDDAAPGAPRICRDYLPASSENAGDGRDGVPGNGLDASDRGTKITH